MLRPSTVQSRSHAQKPYGSPPKKDSYELLNRLAGTRYYIFTSSIHDDFKLPSRCVALSLYHEVDEAMIPGNMIRSSQACWCKYLHIDECDKQMMIPFQCL
uniref:Uncharacterized protein n=1 Tax=Arundo donax TaxID=35708 RepID=A0A0A9D6W9_ARUDO